MAAGLQKQVDEVKQQIEEYKQKYEAEILLTKRLKRQLKVPNPLGDDFE